MVAATFLWVVLGLLVAGFARLVAWDDRPLPWAPVLAAGLAGGVLGGAFRTLLPALGDLPVGFDPAALLLSIGGAALLVWAWYRAIGRRALDRGGATVYRRAA